MKKFLLSLFALINLNVIAISQNPPPSTYPCILSFAVKNQGNNLQICPDISGFKKTGLVEVVFAAPIPAGVNAPTILQITSESDPTFANPFTNIKLVFSSFKSGSRTIANYCYYTPTQANELLNGNGTRYLIQIQYAGFDASVCNAGNCDNCSPLPVSFKSLSATRNKSNVAVKWTTSTESNNRGFNVQRNTGGVWETVAFVFSAAPEGNSTSDLSYSFNDVNTTKGVTQYRLQQVDIDGRSKLSEIRSVKGEAMGANMVVYPNPSETGRVSVVFEDGAPKNVQVSDMSGRVIRSLKSVSHNVSVDGLETGLYSIQVTDLSTSAMTVEKVIIKKR